MLERLKMFSAGKTPIDEMTWCERLYHLLGDGSLNDTTERFIIEHEEDILHRAQNKDYNAFGSPSEWDRQIKFWFSERANCDMDYLDFVSRFARLINEFQCLENFIWTTRDYPPTYRIAMYKKCIEVCEDERLKTKYLERIRSIEKKAEQDELLALVNKLQQKVGFNYVKNLLEEEYERHEARRR